MEFDLFTNVAVIIGLSLIAIVFIYQTQKKHRKVIYLSFSLIIPIFGQILFIIIVLSSSNNTEYLLGKYLRDFLFGIFYFLVFIHFHNLFRETEDDFITNLNFGILTSFFSFLLFSFFYRGPVLLEITGRIANLIGLVCFAYITYVSFLVSKMLKEKEAIVEFVSMFIIFLAHILYVLGDNMILNIPTYENIADLIGTMGLFLLFLNYLLNLDYLYRLPFGIHQIIAYNSAGLCIYTRSVYTKSIKTVKVEEMLFSGLISAISNAIKESLGTKTELRYIDATNKHILLHMYEGLTVVVVADNKSNLLMQSIKTVNSLVKDDLRKKIEDSIVNVSGIEKEFDSIVKIAFPYIQYHS